MMVQNIRKAGIPAAVSYSAGTYVCNDIFYFLQHLAATRYPGLKGGFVHVPYLDVQAVHKPSGTPCMSLEQITRGLLAAAETIVTEQAEIRQPEGTLS